MAGGHYIILRNPIVPSTSDHALQFNRFLFQLTTIPHVQDADECYIIYFYKYRGWRV